MTDSLYNKIEISKIEPDFHIKLYLLILNLAAFYFVCTFQIFTVDEGKFAHDYIDLKVIGLESSKNGEELVLSMYVYDGTKIKYLSENLTINVGMKEQE